MVKNMGLGAGQGGLSPNGSTSSLENCGFFTSSRGASVFPPVKWGEHGPCAMVLLPGLKG